MNGYASRQESVRLAIAMFSLVACSSPAAPAPKRVTTATAAGMGAEATDIVVAEAPVCAADNPFCAGASTPLITQTSTAPAASSGVLTECSTVPIDLTPAGVNIMIGVDGSDSMASPRWPG